MMLSLTVDGNDGTGKSTLCARLRELGIEAADRGLPTRMTDHAGLVAGPAERFLIIDVPVETSRKRLAEAGKDLDERYHTVEDLTHYRRRFQEVAAELGDACILIDGDAPPDEVLKRALEAIRRFAPLKD